MIKNAFYVVKVLLVVVYEVSINEVVQEFGRQTRQLNIIRKNQVCVFCNVSFLRYRSMRVKYNSVLVCECALHNIRELQGKVLLVNINQIQNQQSYQ